MHHLFKKSSSWMYSTAAALMLGSAGCASETGEKVSGLGRGPDGTWYPYVEDNCERGTIKSNPDVMTAETAEAMGIKLAGAPSESMHPDLVELTPLHGGEALYTGVVDLKPGEDLTLCTFIDGVTEEDIFVNNTRGSQSGWGHHSVMFYLPEPEEPGTRECGSMERFRSIQGGSGGGTPQSQCIPEGYVNRVPAGSQFMIQHHWISHSDEVTRVQGMMVYDKPPAEMEPVVLHAGNVATRAWSVPPGEKLVATTECELRVDTPTVAVLAHLHEWGTWTTAEWVKQDGETITLFDHFFGGDMPSNPRVFRYPPEDPLMLEKGDTVRFTCTWENTSDKALEYSVEMCVFNMAAIIDTEFYCLDNQWIELG